MDADKPRPMHQPETFFVGELQEFTGTVVSPDDPSLEPRVQLHVDGPATVTMLCRLPVPARRKGPIEQAVTRRFLESQAG